jgi:hypothetical protein
MNYRLPNLIRNLLPARPPADGATAPAFADTLPNDEEPAPLPPRREIKRMAAARSAQTSSRRAAPSWAESTIDLFRGTDIMEYPDDTAADLMDEFFTAAGKNAARPKP